MALSANLSSSGGLSGSQLAQVDNIYDQYEIGWWEFMPNWAWMLSAGVSAATLWYLIIGRSGQS